MVSTENLKIIADESTNSLVILARTQDYKMIETALKNLDVVALQVLIEASVIEVTPERHPALWRRVVLQAQRARGYRRGDAEPVPGGCG